MRIEKKTWSELFQKVFSGEKNFDVRLADWECNEGDVLVLREWNPETGEYTGRVVEKVVGYIMKTKDVDFFDKEDVEKFGFQVISLR